MTVLPNSVWLARRRMARHYRTTRHTTTERRVPITCGGVVLFHVTYDVSCDDCGYTALRRDVPAAWRDA